MILQARQDNDYRPTLLTIKDAAVRTELYTAISPFTGERDDLWLEQWFGYIESNYGQLLDCKALDGLKKKGEICLQR